MDEHTMAKKDEVGIMRMIRDALMDDAIHQERRRERERNARACLIIFK